MEKEIEKIKEKMLSPIKEEYNLRDYLKSMTKDELTIIRRTLDVKGASSLAKEKLIDKLEGFIKESIVTILHNITEEEYYTLLMMIPKNGITVINLNDINQLEKIIELRSHGIVYPGKINDTLFACIPRDILDDVKNAIEDKDVSSSINSRHKWLRAASGFLYFYGALGKEELYNMIKKAFEEERISQKNLLLKDDKSFEEFKKIMDVNYKGERLVESIDDIYYYYKTEEPQKVFEEHRLSKLNYFALNLKIVFAFGIKGAFNYNTSNYAFYEFLKNNYKMVDIEIENLISECVFKINNEKSEGEVYEFVNSKVNINSIDETKVKDYITALVINNPLWKLKGNTLYNVKKMTGRNDLCYCGSGKKYKKCCGSN